MEKKLGVSVCTHQHTSAFISSSQKCFPWKCFISSPMSWEHAMHKVWAVWWMSKTFPVKVFQELCCDTGSMTVRSALACSQRRWTPYSLHHNTDLGAGSLEIYLPYSLDLVLLRFPPLQITEEALRRKVLLMRWKSRCPSGCKYWVWIEQVMYRRDKCLNHCGNYVEKQRACLLFFVLLTSM